MQVGKDWSHYSVDHVFCDMFTEVITLLEVLALFTFGLAQSCEFKKMKKKKLKKEMRKFYLKYL